VPYVRGREKSRTVEEIKNELMSLVEGGCREVTLLGQNVNSYNDKGVNFPALLKELVKIGGIERIRFMTSHPKDLSVELIDTVAANKKLCKHFHLPVQSGSDRILKLMNRKYSAAEYREKTSKIREKIPGVAITTDVLVGFPGETEADFEETVKLVREMRFDELYGFKYSPREGTEAEKLGDSVPEQEKKRRLNYILDLQKKISEDINRKLIGSEVEVLAYAAGRAGEIRATTDTNKRVYIKNGSIEPGMLAKVVITEARAGALTGEIKK
jgi:tRNA-2-methylthio-N6-dimethylallyladenosine synthase